MICDPPVHYVQHGKYLDLTFNDRAFDIRIGPSQLKRIKFIFI